ncbi:MAG: CinA family nicotinamide mononucleotide deamidase-related protein [Flavisolibacter sp.]
MKQVTAAIITIGDELLIGQTIDTNSAVIARELNKIGIWVKRRLAVGDNPGEILKALSEQSADNDILIITGGLGPTGDDITKPVLCTYFSSTLVVDPAALENVKSIFARLNRPLIQRNLKQAEVPHNCIVLPNSRGTAPGMWFEKESIIYVSLPGVPNEMKGLMLQSVIPQLKIRLDLPVVLHKTLLVAGKGESEISELLVSFEEKLPPYIKLAYLPSYSLVRLRLTGRKDKADELEGEMSSYFEALNLVVRPWVVAREDISIEEAVSKLLRERKKTLATAESCTGGFIAHLITSKRGSSEFYKGSIISYAYEAKENLLGVREETLKRFGAVSEQTVTEMLAGVLQQLKTDYGIATSGIMGPDGGTPDKPVGMVWIAVGNKSNVKAFKYQFRFDRERNIEQTAQTALVLLRRFILDPELYQD